MRHVYVVIALGLGLSGCQTYLEGSSKQNAPLSSKIKSRMAKLNMTAGDPIVVRIFKQEAELEVWKRTETGRYALLKSYPICSWSGELGPKKKEGDRQAPEGFYSITPGLMNPRSSYYLAFNMGYPNKFDRAHGRTGKHLMVHGSCSSRGCYAMENKQIEEIYAFARESFSAGQKTFQVQAFPFRMTPQNMARQTTSPNFDFWRTLKEGSDHFEVTGKPPKVDVCGLNYVFNADADGKLFNATQACPAYEIPDPIYTQVSQKQITDEVAFVKALEDLKIEQAQVETARDVEIVAAFQRVTNARNAPDEPKTGSGNWFGKFLGKKSVSTATTGAGPVLEAGTIVPGAPLPKINPGRSGAGDPKSVKKGFFAKLNPWSK